MTRKDTEARDQRFTEYCRLRDDGMRPVDAFREIGISSDLTRGGYERAYKRLRNLPPSRTSASWSER